jgi:hypothetical protein
MNRTRGRNMEPSAEEGLVFKEEIHIPTSWGYLAGVVKVYVQCLKKILLLNEFE